jgi:hypothetical protein
MSRAGVLLSPLVSAVFCKVGTQIKRFPVQCFAYVARMVP